MKLRIKSDGRHTGTKVYAVSGDGAETEIPGVKHVSWHAEAGKACLAVFMVDGVEVEVDGEHAIPATAAHRGPLDDMGKVDDMDDPIVVASSFDTAIRKIRDAIPVGSPRVFRRRGPDGAIWDLDPVGLKPDSDFLAG